MKSESTGSLNPKESTNSVITTGPLLVNGDPLSGIPNQRSLGEGASFSGNERDSIFLNKGGKDFVNISGITGLDDPGDGRSFAILDYDRDGWPDVVVTSVNAPAIQLYRNRMGSDSFSEVSKNKMLAIRFVGGNHRSMPSKKWSNRDGIGARVTINFDDTKIVRELHAGEGLAAQNSSTLVVGIGERSYANSMTVRWPSGKTQTIGKISENMLLTFYENPAHSPKGSAVTKTPYKVDSIHPPKAREPALR